MMQKLSENILDKFSMDFLRNQVLKNAYGNDDTIIAVRDPRILLVWYLFFGLVPWFVNDLPFLLGCFVLVTVTTLLARVAGLVLLLFTYLAYYRDTLVNALRLTSPDAQLRNAVLAYLEQRYPTATLSDLARSLGYAPAYLSRRIRSIFGKTFQQLLQEQRLSMAAGLLRTSALGVEEIIRTVGYENQSYFYRLFGKTYGMTPHKFRKTSGDKSEN